MSQAIFLRVTEGPASGKQVPVDQEIEIGRTASGPGRIEGDDEMSREHARVTRGPQGELLLYDLGSMNGTFVNGRRVVGAFVLGAGDRISVGGTTLEVVIPSDTELPAPTVVRPSPSAPAAGQGDASASPSPQPKAEPSSPPPPSASTSSREDRQASVILAGLPPTMKGRIFPSVGLLVMQIVVGYEWLLSGLTKIFRGGFPSGLGDELKDESKEAAGWYRDFLDAIIIPNAKAFGYLIEFTELVIGMVLIASGLLWLFRWERMPRRTRNWMLIAIAVASAVAITMNIGFYLASGDPPPFFLADQPFDEGIGLDVILPMLEAIVLAVSVWTWRSLRRARLARSR